MSAVGKVYVITKRTKKGSWVEYYVKIPAKEGKRLGLKHGQKVYVSTVEPSNSTVDNDLLDLLVQLFTLCFQDGRLAKLIVSNPKRAFLVQKIIEKIEGGERG